MPQSSRPIVRSVLRVCVVAVFIVASLCAHASEATTEIAKFFDAGGRAEYGMRQALDQLKQRDPQGAAVVEVAFRHFDQDEIAVRVGVLFEQYLTSDDIQVVRRFAETKAGKLYSAAFRTYKDPSALRSHLDQLRGAERSETLAFQNSPTFGKLIAAMSSPSARKISSDYGEELMCRHFLRNNLQAFREARSQGRCSNTEPRRQ